MIKINHNLKTEESIFIYDSSDTFLGVIDNKVVFDDFRLQIKNDSLSGYYFQFEGVKYDINEYGMVDNYPEQLFSIHDKILSELLVYSNNYVIEKLQELYSKKLYLNIRCKHNSLSKTHFIEITPDNLYDYDDEYIKWDDEFHDNMFNYYPDDFICFCNQDNKIDDVLYNGKEDLVLLAKI